MAIYNQPVNNAIVQKDLPIFGLSRLGVYNRQSAASSYEITDHLGNVRAVVQKNTTTGATDIKSYADYYPFGEQLPGRNSMSNYRYAFQGQELDGETGMEAFQLRLWDGRIGRWLSPDPYGQYASPYLVMGNNPIGMVDPDGGYSWAGAFLRWAGGGFEGKMHQSTKMGDWGINKPSNNTTFDPGDGGIGIQGHTDYGERRNYIREGQIAELKDQFATYRAFHPSEFGDVSLWDENFEGGRLSSIASAFQLANPVLPGMNSIGLADDVAKTFQNGRYTEMTLNKPIVLSRYYDNVNAFAKGRFMTNSISGSKFLDRMGLALRPKWNGMTKVASWEIPAGTTIYKGRAATQFPWLGGKTQYFVPELGNINRITR
jgi:RHS repeat-associated protein